MQSARSINEELKYHHEIDRLATVFRFILRNVSFTQKGSYYLRMSVKSSYTRNMAGVRVRSGESTNFLQDYQLRTDIIKAGVRDARIDLKLTDFVFYLPVGFCKNDPDHDVYLLIECVENLESPSNNTSSKSSRLVGEARLPIYPIPQTQSVNYDNVELGEPFYQLDGTLRLLRVNTFESEPAQAADNAEAGGRASTAKSLHCGQFTYSVDFAEIQPIFERQPTPKLYRPSAIPRQNQPLNQNSREKTMDKATSPKPSTPALSYTSSSTSEWPDREPEYVEMPPSQTTGDAANDVNAKFNILSSHGFEEISLIIHGALNLWIKRPDTTYFVAPRAYVVCKIVFDEDDDKVEDKNNKNEENDVTARNEIAQHNTAQNNANNNNSAGNNSYNQSDSNDNIFATNCSQFEHQENPSWETLINLRVPVSMKEKANLEIIVADSPNQLVIVKYQIPIIKLQPFYHYHFKAVENNLYKVRDHGSPVLFFSIVRKQNTFPDPPSDHNYVAFMARLLVSSNKLNLVDSSLIAVAQLSNSPKFSATNDSLNNTENSMFKELEFRTVKFPDLQDSHFSIQQNRTNYKKKNKIWMNDDQTRQLHSASIKSYQISLPGFPPTKPQWNFPFLFCQNSELATLFTPNAAINIQFYQYIPKVNRELDWKSMKPIAQFSFPVDQTVFSELNSARLGIRTRVNFTGQLKSIDDEQMPSANIHLQLFKHQWHDEAFAPRPKDLPDLFLNNANKSDDAAEIAEKPPLAQKKEAQPFLYEIKPVAGKAKPNLKNLNTENVRKLSANNKLYGRSMSLSSQQKHSKKSVLPPSDSVARVLTNNQTPQQKDKRRFSTFVFDNADDQTEKLKGSVAPQILFAKNNEDILMMPRTVKPADRTHLTRYHVAMEKMAKDLQLLKSRLKELETENDQLQYFTGVNSNDSLPLNVNIKQQNLANYLSLKNKILKTTKELELYREKSDQLEKQLNQSSNEPVNYFLRKSSLSSQAELLQQIHREMNQARSMQDQRTNSVNLEDENRQLQRELNYLRRKQAAEIYSK